MQKRLLRISTDSISNAIASLEEVKTADIKSRKSAKPSAKAKWTKRITSTTKLIETLKSCRRFAKTLPKRVA